MNQFCKEKNEEMQSHIVLFPPETLIFSPIAASNLRGRNLTVQ